MESSYVKRLTFRFSKSESESSRAEQAEGRQRAQLRGQEALHPDVGRPDLHNLAVQVAGHGGAGVVVGVDGAPDEGLVRAVHVRGDRTALTGVAGGVGERLLLRQRLLFLSQAALLDDGKIHLQLQLGALDAAEGMAFLHSGRPPMIHRDIKAGNILLTEQGGCKLADFGLARQLDGAEATWSGDFAGTPGYWAPEIEEMYEKRKRGKHDHEPHGLNADVWSMGVMVQGSERIGRIV